MGKTVSKQEILNYCANEPVNIAVLNDMLDTFRAADNPDLSGITATADKILATYKSVDTTGAEVVGTCNFDTNLAQACALEEGESYAEEGDITLAENKVVFIYKDGALVKVKG